MSATTGYYYDGYRAALEGKGSHTPYLLQRNKRSWIRGYVKGYNETHKRKIKTSSAMFGKDRFPKPERAKAAAEGVTE